VRSLELAAAEALATRTDSLPAFLTRLALLGPFVLAFKKDRKSPTRGCRTRSGAGLRRRSSSV
jgi:hypothetical protein